MDSLTQIVLGAAVGELVLGRKLGNRAMVWGAVAGTIPDLDVVGNLFMSDIDALAFHRGVSHSFSFAIIFSFVIAWYTRWLYSDQKAHQSRTYRIVTSVGAVLFSTFAMSILGGIIYSVGNTFAKILAIALAVGLMYWIVKKLIDGYINSEQKAIDISYKAWYWFFFWTIITHPILDSFTAYGTQLFAPFSDYRVSFNNISVADPLYTIPFLVCLLVASFHHKTSGKRRNWNYLGLVLSSLYMIFTIGNKLRIDGIMQDTIEAQNIDAIRYTTNPSILNNVLWSGTVETDSFFYQGLYSMFDSKHEFKLAPIPKNHKLLADAKEDDKTINIIRWFSNEYYAVLVRKDGNLQINDMRYGRFGESSSGEDDYIFRFPLLRKDNGYYDLSEAQGGPPEGGESAMMASLWNRIKGL